MELGMSYSLGNTLAANFQNTASEWE
jgi:hypothetical protein